MTLDSGVVLEEPLPPHAVTDEITRAAIVSSLSDEKLLTFIQIFLVATSGVNVALYVNVALRKHGFE